MISQTLKLAGAAALGVASVAISISAPTLTNLSADDLAAFSNGARVEVTAYRPGRALAGGLGAAGLGLLGWWLWKELTASAETAPIETIPVNDDEMTGQFIKAPAGVPAPNKYIDVSAVVAQRLRPTLITGNPRIGKGIVVAHAIRHVKRSQPDAPVWLIQPKYHRKERAYWEPCDRVMGFMLEDYLSGDEDVDALCKELSAFIHEWRKQSERPTLLVIDELSLIKGILPKWYKEFLIPQLITEMSSGETDDRALWGITQSPLAEDIGMSGGNRAPFDLLAIENPDSQEHLHSLARSYRGVSLPEDDLVYRQSLSPKKAIFYHSARQEWLPMLPYAVPGGCNESSEPLQGGVTPVTQDSVGNVGIQGEGQLQPVTQVTRYTIHQVLRVQSAVTEGMPESEIVKDVLGYKGRNYDEGKAILNEIQSILEENS